MPSMYILHTGLGTSTSKEAKEYFSNMARHRILFKYAGTEDDAAILLVSAAWNTSVVPGTLYAPSAVL